MFGRHSDTLVEIAPVVVTLLMAALICGYVLFGVGKLLASR